MSDSFVAGLLVGLFTGGFIGALGVAVVAAGSGRRFPADLRKVPFHRRRRGSPIELVGKTR